jgi:hypothetical protein
VLARVRRSSGRPSAGATVGRGAPPRRSRAAPSARAASRSAPARPTRTTRSASRRTMRRAAQRRAPTRSSWPLTKRTTRRRPGALLAVPKHARVPVTRERCLRGEGCGAHASACSGHSTMEHAAGSLAACTDSVSWACAPPQWLGQWQRGGRCTVQYMGSLDSGKQRAAQPCGAVAAACGRAGGGEPPVATKPKLP